MTDEALAPEHVRLLARDVRAVLDVFSRKLEPSIFKIEQSLDDIRHEQALARDEADARFAAIEERLAALETGTPRTRKAVTPSRRARAR